MSGAPTEDVIIEFHAVGDSVRVSAMDPATLTEVVLVGPASAGEAALTRAVVNKLRYRLDRMAQTRPRMPARSGIVV